MVSYSDELKPRAGACTMAPKGELPTALNSKSSSLTFHDRGLLQTMGQEVDAGIGVGRGQGARARAPTCPTGATASHSAKQAPEAPGPAPGAPVPWL